MKVVATGGGFDPIREGHIRLFKAARELGDVLVVMLNSDHQLQLKKKKTFYPNEYERFTIISALKYVDWVVIDPGSNVTCEKALELIKPNIFAKGGDRTPDTMPTIELETCKRLGIEIVYNVGGPKITSSRDLTGLR